MTYFFTSLLQPLLPIALLLAASWARFAKINTKWLTWITLFGFAAGLCIAPYLGTKQIINLSLNSTLVCVILFFLLSQCIQSTKLNAFWHFILTTLATIQWVRNPNIAAITNTDVINTDFILHLSAVILGVLFCVFFASWLVIALKQNKIEKKLTALRWMILLLISALCILPAIGEILLSLMKLQTIELTKPRLSLVAKANSISIWNNYAIAAILFLSLLLFVAKIHVSRVRQVKTEHNSIEKRKKIAASLVSRRLIVWGFTSLFIIVSAQLYWDKIASQPPQLSEALPVKLDAQNQIRIPIQQVKDGQLHRFVWIAEDGKAVRFFIINRKPDYLSLAAVFDACLLCGDQGYVMRNGQVECIGCGVRMFIPSIGKPGGCNPVPIEDWQQDENDVIIDRTSLEAGLNLFSTVVEIQVIDPVDGSKLTNTKTEFKYTLDNKTYFFAKEENLNLFRDNPENYLQNPATPGDE